MQGRDGVPGIELEKHEGLDDFLSWTILGGFFFWFFLHDGQKRGSKLMFLAESFRLMGRVT